MVQWINRQSSCEQRFTDPKSAAKTEMTDGFNLLLQTLIDYLLFGLQPVFESMAVLSAMLLIQGVGPLRYSRMEVMGMFIRLVSNGVLLVP
jgi:hypothetical protein